MKTFFLALMAAVALGAAAPAFADGGDLTPDTQFTLQQQRLTDQQQPKTVAHQTTGSTMSFPLQSRDLGTWLFAPDEVGGGNS